MVDILDEAVKVKLTDLASKAAQESRVTFDPTGTGMEFFRLGIADLLIKTNGLNEGKWRETRLTETLGALEDRSPVNPELFNSLVYPELTGFIPKANWGMVTTFKRGLIRFRKVNDRDQLNFPLITPNAASWMINGAYKRAMEFIACDVSSLADLKKTKVLQRSNSQVNPKPGRENHSRIGAHLPRF